MQHKPSKGRIIGDLSSCIGIIGTVKNYTVYFTEIWLDKGKVYLGKLPYQNDSK